jgi:hypothetical protein
MKVFSFLGRLASLALAIALVAPIGLSVLGQSAQMFA